MSFVTRSIILVTPKQVSPQELGEAYRTLCTEVKIIGDRVLASGEWGQFAIDPDHHVTNEYSEARMASIHRCMKEPFFFAIRFTSANAANVALTHWPDKTGVMADNDLWRFDSLAVVVDAIRSGFNWVDAEAEGRRGSPSLVVRR